MTGPEAKEAFLIYYDRVTSFAAPGYEDEEIYQFLSDAQLEFVKERTFGLSNLPPKFDENEKRVADLFPLIETSSIITTSSAVAYGNAYSVQKSDSGLTRPLYTFRVEARLTRSGYPEIATLSLVECERISNKNAAKFRSNTFNKPHFVKPKWYETNKYYIVIADAYTTSLTGLMINYVKNPYPISADSAEYNGTYTSQFMNLHESTHKEIVDLAVKNALQVIGDPRWQTKTQQEQMEPDK